MTRTVILLSPHFPPSPLAGVHRARHMAKHLPAHGWRPIVLSPEDRAYSERLDPLLAALVPTTVEQVKVPALDAGIMRRFGIGDVGLRAFAQFSAAIDRLVVTEKPSALFITGAPYYPMLLARRAARRHGLPVVLDFQDPWVSVFGARQPPLSKAGLAHRLATWLEPIAVRHATHVTSVSDVQNQEMAARYPWLTAETMTAIQIGGDPEDYANINAVRPGHRGQPVNLCYVGAYWPRAEPCLRQLFRGLAALRRRQPDLAERLKLTFIGTCSSNQADDNLDRPVLAIAEQEGVGDLVVENPLRAPFVEALRLMATADGLLLIGSDEPHYTASKIYPALMSGRPFLSLFHAASSAHAILSAAGGGRALAFDSEPSLVALTDQLADGLASLAFRPESLGSVDPRAYADYTAYSVAGRFAGIFNRLTSQ